MSGWSGQNRKTLSSGEEEDVLQTLWERFDICPNSGVHKKTRVIRKHPDLCIINTQLLACLHGLVGKPIRKKGGKVIKSQRMSGHLVPGSGCYLSRWAAGAEQSVEVFDEDLSEDVDRHQSGQRDGTLPRPNQVHPENTGQVRWTHFINDTLLRNHVEETDQVLQHNEMMFGKTFNDLLTPRHPQAALHIEDLLDLVVDSEGQQRFRQLSEKRLQDHSGNMDVTVLVKVHRLPKIIEFLDVLDELNMS